MGKIAGKQICKSYGTLAGYYRARSSLAWVKGFRILLRENRRQYELISKMRTSQGAAENLGKLIRVIKKIHKGRDLQRDARLFAKNAQHYAGLERKCRKDVSKNKSPRPLNYFERLLLVLIR